MPAQAGAGVVRQGFGNLFAQQLEFGAGEQGAAVAVAGKGTFRSAITRPGLERDDHPLAQVQRFVHVG